MSNDKQPAPTGGGGDGSAEVEVLSQRTLDTFLPMLMLWPQEDGSQATDRIVAALLAATDLDGLNAPWEGDNTAAMRDRTIIITGGKLLPSRLDTQLKFFLRLEAVDARTGEPAAFTTSSLSIVAQVTNALAREALPIRVKVIRSDEPTSRGFWPYHLQMLAERVSVARVTAEAGT